MFVTAIIFTVVAAALVVASGLQTSALAANPWLRRLAVLGSLLAAILGGALIFEFISPAAPSGEGKLYKDGDVVALNQTADGILSVECQMFEGVNKPGLALKVRMDVAGDGGQESHQATFQLGDSPEGGDNPKVSNMGKNIPMKGLGQNTKLTLTKISDDKYVSVHVSYRPSRFPTDAALIALFVLVLLAAAFEGAAPSGWRRTFLTVSVAMVASFAWLLENGLTADDSGWTIWIRLAYAVAMGAVIGTLLPAIVGKFLPEFKSPPREGVASESNEETTT